ncbi:MAG: hypothetical protein RIR26_680 [Pseudomonadota bacterium]|jgi:hypothetical protein
MNLYALAIVSLVLVGCDGKVPSDGGKALAPETSQTIINPQDELTSLLLESAEKLTACTVAREGVLAYLIVEQEFRACS